MSKEFKKETSHQGGSIPFWDWNWSAHLTIKSGDRTICLDAFDLLDLKKILKDFDGRVGEWKETKKVEG